MRVRALIEPKNGELARWHGLRRARYWELVKTKLQAIITTLAVNFKRWAQLGNCCQSDKQRYHNYVCCIKMA